MPNDFALPPGGRPRSGAISFPAGPGDIFAAQGRREIDLARQNNLRQMFGGTKLITKATAQAKRAKEVADAAKKVKTDVKHLVGPIHVPVIDLSLPDLSMPAIDFPTVNLPSINFPSIDLPSIALPSFNLPSFSLPDFNLPPIDFPDLNLPSIRIGDININLEIPGMRRVLQLLMDLFDGLSLPEILFEIGTDFFTDFLSAALPILGQIKSGAQAANEWGKAAKKGYQAYKVGGQKEVMLTGDPRVAADAVKTLLQRAAVDHTAKASIKTAQFGTSTAALFVDAGALSGPLISAASSIATLCLRIHVIALAHKEKVAGNLALAQPEKLDAGIFAVSPTLGCYLLTCSDTSSVINVLTSDIGRQNWMTDATAMKKKIDPLLSEATKFIVSSPYELQGLKSNKGIFLPKKKKNMFGF